MIRVATLSAVALLFGAVPSHAITVEFLQAGINPAHVNWLWGIACRNEDHIVHLDIGVDWPAPSVDDRDGIFSFGDSGVEFAFPKGSYSFLHSEYIIKGYFIVRSMGIHHGVIGNSFEKVSDAQVILSSGVKEKRVKSGRCKV